MPGNSQAQLVPQQGLGQKSEPRKWEVGHRRCPNSETKHKEGVTDSFCSPREGFIEKALNN